MAPGEGDLIAACCQIVYGHGQVAQVVILTDATEEKQSDRCVWPTGCSRSKAHIKSNRICTCTVPPRTKVSVRNLSEMHLDSSIAATPCVRDHRGLTPRLARNIKVGTAGGCQSLT